MPEGSIVEIRDVVLDFNGTIAKDGFVLPGVAERLRRRRMFYEKLSCFRHRSEEYSGRLGPIASRKSPESDFKKLICEEFSF
jgi:hypothetical protein